MKTYVNGMDMGREGYEEGISVGEEQDKNKHMFA